MMQTPDFYTRAQNKQHQYLPKLQHHAISFIYINFEQASTKMDQ